MNESDLNGLLIVWYLLNKIQAMEFISRCNTGAELGVGSNGDKVVT